MSRLGYLVGVCFGDSTSDKIRVFVNDVFQGEFMMNEKRPDVIEYFSLGDKSDLVGFNYPLKLKPNRMYEVKIEYLDVDGEKLEFSKTLWVIEDIDNKKKFDIQKKFEQEGVKLGYPSELFLEFSKECNLDCIMCRKGVKVEGSLMSWEVFKRYKEFIKHAKFIYLNGWGESIVHPDFPKFLGEVKSINPNALYSITTNLNIIKKEVIEFFTESKDSVITISIDAATKKTYEKIRCRGSWDSLWENMAELRRIIKQKNTGYPKLIVEFVVQKDNIHEISDFIKLIYEKVNPSKIMFQDVVAHPELSANYENYKEETPG